jgi:hypothetical protein
MARKQLNIRVPDAVRDTLDAAVFVRDLRGPQELVEAALEEVAAELRRDPLVRDALALRSKSRSSRGAKIHRLPTAGAGRRSRR